MPVSFLNLFFICWFFINLIISGECVCDIDSWTCDDTSCITTDLLCDGAKDCADGSDETAVNCQLINCPPYAFQCAYGGCISKKKRCNGIVDCADGSDETPLLCGTKEQQQIFNEILQGNCNAEEIYCKETSECISKYDKCDGYRHCPDGSDETVDLCSTTLSCPRFAFKCSYGGCLTVKAKCNGTTECWDQSDESWQLCGRDRTFKPFSVAPPTTTERITTPRTTLRTTTISTGIRFPDSENCVIPEHMSVRTFAGEVYHEEVPKNTFFTAICDAGYSLNTNLTSTGLCNGVMVPPFKCIKYCPAETIFNDFTTTPICFVKGERVDCRRNSILPETIVKFECAISYKSLFALSPRKCSKDGRWEGIREGCSLECGRLFKSRQFSNFGIPSKAIDVPWNVAIYGKFNEVDYAYACCGSIVSPIIIITAAHCVFERVTSKSYPVESFLVVPRKEHRAYDTNEAGFELRDIHVHKDFKYDNKFENDVAILVLQKHITFSDNVRPVCLHNRKSRGEAEQVSNIRGYFAGFNQESRYLERINAVQYSHAECRARKSGQYLSPDKFCLATEIGTACRGDSGSGYVFEEEGIVHLYGIVSHAPTATDDCAVDDVLVVNVFYFLDWIQSVIIDEHFNYFG